MTVSQQLVFLFLCIGMFMISSVSGHARWKYPTPRTSDSGLKSYPCGGVEFFGNGQPVTILQPGKQILQFEETISHTGAPFRIALSINSDSNYEKYILIDHIPHNDQSDSSSLKVYQYLVDIPNIKCQKCSISLTNPMTDKQSGCCSYPTTKTGNSELCGSVYHSCANIQINGTVELSNFKYNYTGPCGDYTQESSSWTKQSDDSWKLDNMYTGFYVPPTSQQCSRFKISCNETYPEVSNNSQNGNSNNEPKTTISNCIPSSCVAPFVFYFMIVLFVLLNIN
ncbi:predicted protein [Naegleria gruberi]|uniref:Predicted protein n=1 Tax=Naegleria gruberi TaxID=5762 RepID=D2VYS5_NAEGR|nr:uncharacterized protein NAEGRDRAFT_74224 [Naegleria gruberi]EFC38007.1 predicted protein [Naegleria gruberi]|eukprot:XP_002670751.1 predicted protein [Naegleria gruberi strain NEG-M]